MLNKILDFLSGRSTQREIMKMQTMIAFDPERWEQNWERKRMMQALIFENVMAGVEERLNGH